VNSKCNQTAHVRPLRSALGAIFLTTTGLATATLAFPVTAAAQAVRIYDIPGGSLADAINSFGEQSGTQILYDAALTQGRSSQGLKGQFGVAEGLSRLLAGSGVTFRQTGPNIFTLERAPQSADGAIQLGPVRVEGEGSGSTGLGIAPSVTSDPNATENTGSFTTRIMSSATRLPLTMRETPQSVTVITSKRIEAENLVDLVDVVDATPGLIVHYNTARPSFTSRGAVIDLITQDGIATTFDLANNDTLGSMAMQDRVEIVRGATGLMQGSGNPSGAINLIRKRPTREFQIRGTASIGSWDDYRVTADISGPLTSDGRIRARAVGYYQDAGNFRDIEFDDNRLGYVTVDIDLTDRTLFNLGYSYTYSNRNGLWGALPIGLDGKHLDLPRSTFQGADWEYGIQTANSVYASLTHDFGSDWNLKLNATYIDGLNRTLATFLIPTPDQGGYGFVWWAIRKSREQKAVDAYVSGPVNLLGQQHELVFGGTLNHEKHKLISWFDSWDNLLIPGTDLATWNHVAPHPDTSATSPYRSDDTTHVNQDSLYAAGRFGLTDSLKLILGARLDWYDQRGEGGTRFRTDGHLTKYAGLTWDFTSDHSVYVSYTDIFRPQSQRGITGDILPPITGKNYEFGIKGEYLEGALNSSVAIFMTDESNRALFLNDQSACPIYPAEYCYASAGLLRTKGIDAELQGEVVPGWQIGAGFTWSRRVYRKDLDPTLIGKRTDTQVPTTQVKISTQYTLPGALNRLTVGGRVTWQSHVYYDSENYYGEISRNEQKSYAILDLSASYRVTKNINSQLSINNVFDKTYYRDIGTHYYWHPGDIYGEPRNIMLTIRANF